MAEHKKSFILYTDIIHTVRKLPKNKQADLFMAILEYVNDENPVVKDLLVGVAFEPIKHQLKRDLVNWESTKVERSKSGHLGGLKSGEVRRKKKEIEANEASALKSKQKEANEAVTATVNDTVTATATIDRQKVVESLRRCSPNTVSTYQLGIEADDLIKQYGGKKINNLQALCNKWMENYQVTPMLQAPVKQMVQ